MEKCVNSKSNLAVYGARAIPNPSFSADTAIIITFLFDEHDNTRYCAVFSKNPGNICARTMVLALHAICV